ncbi:Desert hedgehog protein B [Gracilariopsis chorda]|uniref:Desert hedgehog protein B n=1 Tax=Gracilariopsis chorda TaxID=448386 RepID=A0A2V3IVL1_9FLOR|nr:Desert hedgehog protein B [Gracilariopsis chorda]|eukprot:PXF45747.1 Desert hedgehog protein B [Gracilariopsis chorda]
MRRVAPAVFAALFFTLACADILWDKCVGEADFPDIKEGNYFNLCIKEHEFKDEKWAWTLTKTNVIDTVFDGCFFENTRQKTSNFTEASWQNVMFKDCRFSSFTDLPMVFDHTVLTNVQFVGCTFHSSTDIVFREFEFNNVSFTDCDFQGDTNFTLGQINEISILNSRFKRSESATTPSGNDAFRLHQLNLRNMLIKDSEFINPVRFEGVSAADVSINDTSISKMYCHSLEESTQFQSQPQIKHFSNFNDTAFAGVDFNDKLLCDQTSWRGMFMVNVTFWDDASFAKSDVLDLYWDGVRMKSRDGAQSELDFSDSSITRRVLANTTIEGISNFRKTIFETVRVQNLDAGTKPIFNDAEFRQEYIDGVCCTKACKSLKCKCNITDVSGVCPIGKSDVNTSAIDTCFPASAAVRRHDGAVLTMEQLAVAERIAVGAGQHSDLFFFGHRAPHAVSEFVSIRHGASDKPLRISPQHYLYVNGKLGTAKTVRVGDRLRGADGVDNVLVTAVDREAHRGLYAPTSMHGDLLVDDIVVSSYTSALPPHLAHKLLHPLRLLYRYAPTSLVKRFTLFHEQSWEGVARMLRLPRGGDVIED